VACQLYVTFGRPGLPDRFEFDAQVIRSIASGDDGLQRDSSYLVVGELYRIFYLADQPVVAGILAFALYCTAIIPQLRRSALLSSPIVTLPLLILQVALGAIFLGTYSKDIFIVPIALVAVVAPVSRAGNSTLLLFMLLYAQFFRSYWYLIVLVFIALYVLNIRKLRLVVTIGAIVLGYLILTYSFPLVLDRNIGSYRESVNVYRLNSENARTMINPVLEGSGYISEFGNTVLSWLYLQAPIPLFQIGTVYHLCLGLIILFVWTAFWICCWRSWRSDYREPWVNRSLCLVLAYVMVQGVFEPDYGSALRHLTPLLPVLCLVIVVMGQATARRVETEVSHAVGLDDRLPSVDSQRQKSHFSP
jgi:hypothetical protein